MLKTMLRTFVCLLVGLGTFGLTCTPAGASMMRTRISAEINTVWTDIAAGLAVGDEVYMEFIYDDGDISHDPWVPGSLDPFRRYQSDLQVVWDQELLDWMQYYGGRPDQPDTGTYRLYEPDGTELNEMFTVDNSDFLLSVYHSFGAVGDAMYFSFYGAYGGFEAYGLTVETKPFTEVPEPATLVLFAACFPFIGRRWVFSASSSQNRT